MTLICFDLDGTLVDPCDGMLTCLGATCKDFGLPCPRRDQLSERIGLDLATLFQGLPGSQRDEAMARYWRLFSEEGLFAQRIQDGAHLMLARLKRQGHRLLLVTCQPTALARRTLHQFDLLLIFDAVLGLLPQEPWLPKGELMERFRRDGALEGGGYLIGDRADDMRAAKAHGLRAVGVSYGFGTAQELTDAPADLILDSVQDLDEWLEKELKDPEVHDPFSRSE